MANDGALSLRRRPADRPRPAISERAQQDAATIARARALEDRALALLSGALDAHPDNHTARGPLSPGLRSELARRISAANPEARALLSEADALLWQIVATYEAAIRHRARGWSRMTAAVGSDPDDLAAAARLGCWRGLLRWRPDGGSAPLHFALQWAESTAQRDNTTTGDLCGGLSTRERSRGWRRPRSVIAARLDAPIRTPSGDPGARLIEFVSGADADPADQISLRQLWQQVERCVSGLHPRAQEVLRARLAGQTLTEIGESLGISRERTRQIEAAALVAIREALGVAPVPPPPPPPPVLCARPAAPPAPGTIAARVAKLLQAEPAATASTIAAKLGINPKSASALAGRLRAEGHAPPRPASPAPPPIARTGTLATDLAALIGAYPGISVAAAVIALASTEASVRTVVKVLQARGVVAPHDPARPGLHPSDPGA